MKSYVSKKFCVPKHERIKKLWYYLKDFWGILIHLGIFQRTETFAFQIRRSRNRWICKPTRCPNAFKIAIS